LRYGTGGIHAHTAECGVPKTVKEMYVRIFTMFSMARLLATALFICESDVSIPFCFALRAKKKLGQVKLKLRAFLASTPMNDLFLALSNIFRGKEHLK
jgi:hypothetical protein